MADEITTTTPETVEAVDQADAVENTDVQETKDVKAAPKRKKAKRAVPYGQVHILASFNNTIVSFTDPKGGVLSWSSAGSNGFRGSKKGTAYAAQVATEQAGQTAKQLHGFSKADVLVSGIGLGREAAIRSLQNLDISVESICDVTGVPHGGVRPKKARRA